MMSTMPESAQIVYEATGCLMPRDLHRYDAMLKDLGKYGIKQNKAIAQCCTVCWHLAPQDGE